MSLRTAMEEALQRGEKFKDQVLNDVLSSQAVNQLMHNELFLKSLTKVLTTKHEIQQAMKKNVKAVLKAFNVPTRDEINSMSRKLNRLETEVDGIHRKVLTSRLVQAKKKAAPKRKRATKAKATQKKAKKPTKGRK